MTLAAPLIQAFFTNYLVTQRRVSPNTVHAYRDTWKLFLIYISETTNTPVSKISVEQVDHDQVAAFLTFLETDRRNTVSTRNARLAAIHAWCQYAAQSLPDHVGDLARVIAIPVKKYCRPELTWLTDLETQALLEAIPNNTWTGRRDKAMLTLAANTGLRVAEITNLTISDVHLDKPPYVSCQGKGRKRRTTPITGELAVHLSRYLCERATRPGQALFPGPNGQPLSVDAIQHRLAITCTAAAQTCSTLADKHITMHTLRHYVACLIMGRELVSYLVRG